MKTILDFIKQWAFFFHCLFVEEFNEILYNSIAYSIYLLLWFNLFEEDNLNVLFIVRKESFTETGKVPNFFFHKRQNGEALNLLISFIKTFVCNTTDDVRYELWLECETNVLKNGQLSQQCLIKEWITNNMGIFFILSRNPIFFYESWLVFYHVILTLHKNLNLNNVYSFPSHLHSIDLWLSHFDMNSKQRPWKSWVHFMNIKIVRFVWWNCNELC